MSAPAVPPPPEVTLVVRLAGVERVVRIEPADWTEAVIGRGEQALVFLNHPSVSRRHARLVRRAGEVWLDDLGSASGTTRGGVKVTSEVRLADGDRVGVGEVEITVRVVRAADVERRKAELVKTVMPGEVKPAPRPAPAPAPAPAPTPTPATGLDPTLPRGGDHTIRMTKPSAVASKVKASLDGVARVALGRASTSDVVLDSPLVSRSHAELRREGDGFVLADLGSTNGTFVGGERVAASRRLVPGDELSIGPFRLRYDGRSLVTAPPSAGMRIEVRELGKQVNDRATGKPLYLLKDVSLTILPKEFVGLLGSSGCGKSTFMDTVNGRRPATEGAVLYDGENLYNQFDRFKRGIGYVPQELIFHDGLPVVDVLRYASRLRLPDDTTAEEIEANIDRVLAVVGLVAQKGTLVKHLSGGQKKRVSIAMELLSRPTLLFLDEATSGLDLGTEAQMMRLFRELADGGVTTLCITHYVDSLEMCDLVAYFVKGRLAFYGPPKELKTYFGVGAIREVYVKETEKSAEQWEAEFRAHPAYATYVQGRASLPAPADATRVKPGEALEQVRPRDLKRQLRTLTERYVQILRSDGRALALGLGLAPVIGLLVALVLGGTADETAMQLASRQGKLSFILTISTCFLGLFGAIREVVKELPVYRHERFINLEVGPYLLSKALPLAALGFLQVLGLLIVTHLFADVRAPLLGQLVVLTVTSIAAALLGLAISSAVDSSDKAVMLMILVIIPQFLFANAFIELNGVGKLLGIVAILCYWCHDGMKSLLPSDLLATPVPGTGGLTGMHDGVPVFSEPSLVLFGHNGVFVDLVLLLVFAAGYGALAYVFLRKKDGPTGKPFSIPWIRTGTWAVLRLRLRWLLGQAADAGFAGLRRLGRKMESLGNRGDGTPPTP